MSCHKRLPIRRLVLWRSVSYPTLYMTSVLKETGELGLTDNFRPWSLPILNITQGSLCSTVVARYRCVEWVIWPPPGRISPAATDWGTGALYDLTLLVTVPAQGLGDGKVNWSSCTQLSVSLSVTSSLVLGGVSPVWPV